MMLIASRRGAGEMVEAALAVNLDHRKLEKTARASLHKRVRYLIAARQANALFALQLFLKRG
jgi:hypothetical protein